MKNEILARLKDKVYVSAIILLISDFIRQWNFNTKNVVEFLFTLFCYIVVGYGVGRNYTVNKEGDNI